MADGVDAPSPSRVRSQVPWAIFGTLVLAIALTACAFAIDGLPNDWLTVAVLGVLLLATRMVRVNTLAGVSVASSSIITLASVVLIGPFGVAVLTALTILVERGRRKWNARVFNASMGAVVGAVAGLTYLWCGGPRDLTAITDPWELLWRVGGPLMVANVAQSVVNLALLATIMRVSDGHPFKAVFVSMATTSGLSQMGYGIIGLLLVLLWIPAEVGPFSGVLILAPLFVAHWAFLQHADEQRAHERTLAALVATAETRDPYAVGHSERVARLAEIMAEQLGLGAAHTSALRYAAMLHDIGQVGSPLATASEDLAPDDDELAFIERHPDSGVGLLADISFLAESLAGIRHHHERWDGRGYPDGLVGPDIPIESRIIATADAFDSLTSTRPGRQALEVPAALAALAERTGSHLDGEVVAALYRGLERHPWVPKGASVTEIRSAPVDHDHPAVSDLLARRHTSRSRSRR
ncbi:MAG: HD domain-containing phosphohydrolase [Candidatus Phosphoribacter sp.]|nr:HD domain-containing protein [Actinomycetales bacterium]